MDTDVLYFALAALAVGLAINLRLTLSVLGAARDEHDTKLPLPVGHAIPPVSGRLLMGGGRAQVGGAGQASVLLFMISQCPKCRGRIAEVEAMLPLALDAGLALWLVSEERAFRLRTFVGRAGLARRTVRVSQNDFLALNPLQATPTYLFVNADGVLEASGLIGDDNWQALRSQLASPQDRAA